MRRFFFLTMSLSQDKVPVFRRDELLRRTNWADVVSFLPDKGLLLLIDLIRLLSPSHVVQFSSSRSKYMPNLTPDYVDDMDGLYTKSKSKVRNRGFQLTEFAESLEFADEDKESPLMFTGHKLMCVQSDFAFRKTPRNR